ncbi:hypothetical protein Glove_153g19 [Diversispora epigaea]|uniref:CMP/dCMP-type deaminase domain-containing protein n=1 Tax=Diversispora epigaea TaxID=1348612 RepID=A0A397IWA2_9GLOM|nr:hypothetical protein Glove_153g19 [Diversispora epigaea]
MPTSENDLHYMRIALEQAKLSEPISSAYCVGAVIVKNDTILATGYSRELPGNTHAEECAIQKLKDNDNDNNNNNKDIIGSTMYTTMEPCSKRLSGKKCCVDRIKEIGIPRVVIGCGEPDNFVKCYGIENLKEFGIEVVLVKELEEECLKCNKHLGI